MRPILVLALVLLGVGALLLALLNTGSDPRRGSTLEPDRTSTAADTPRASIDLEGAAATPRPATGESNRAAADPVATQVTRTVVDREDDAPALVDNWLRGTVLDPEGAPVAGAAVSVSVSSGPPQFAMLRQAMPGGGEEAPARQAVTDPEGKFAFSTLEPSTEYTIVASHPDYMRTEVPYVEVGASGEFQRDVQLETGYLLMGYVYDAAGQPVPEARLELMPTFLAAIPGVREKREQYDFKETVSREDGSYRIENVTGGPKVLRCESVGFGTESVPNLQFAGGKDVPVTRDFRLKPAKSIAGRVVSPALEGIRGATVEALHYKTGQRSGGGSTTNAAGDFEIPNLAEGTYMIIVHADGFSDHRQNRIDAGTPDLLVELVEQASIAGRVIEDSGGSPLPGFHVALRQVNKNANYYGRAVKNAEFPKADNGMFSLGGVEPGEYVVQATAPGYAPTYSAPFSVTQGVPKEDVVVRMTRGGTLRGRIISRNDGSPVAGAVVQTQDNAYVENPLSELLGAMVPRTTTAKKVRTDKDGRFEIDLITPEVYQLSIEHPNFTKETVKDLRIEEAGVTEMPPLRLSAGGIVRGTVYGADGQPLNSASVNLRGAGGAGLPRSYQATADGNGRFTIRRIAPGNYVINATNSPAKLSGSPFDAIIEMKNSEKNITVSDGGEHTMDLYLGG